MVAAKIKRKSDSTWLDLPTPVVMTPAVNALDSSKSGRDNNTGAMFRDKIAEKQSYIVTFPFGLNNTQVAKILQIVMESEFNLYCPNPKTGTYDTKTFYTATVTPDIHHIESENLWYYNEFSFEAVEM
ncbi:MAG: hypothetical protein E7547_02905 [Ruminococcaceae bacterium]|nr:hypothetical protein [Oscillospiraceae bacterium]